MIIANTVVFHGIVNLNPSTTYRSRVHSGTHNLVLSIVVSGILCLFQSYLNQSSYKMDTSR